MGQPTWDERYGGADYVYGTEPNDFLRGQIQNLPPGRVLCVAEGEGRNFSIEPNSWDAIVSIFAHTPPPVRRHVHSEAVRGLKPGGAFLLDAYRPEQLEYKTGGPPVVEMMMTLELLRAELPGLDVEYAQETVRDINEGKLHTGQAAVVQLLARKP